MNSSQASVPGWPSRRARKPSSASLRGLAPGRTDQRRTRDQVQATGLRLHPTAALDDDHGGHEVTEGHRRRIHHLVGVRERIDIEIDGQYAGYLFGTKESAGSGSPFSLSD